MLFNRPRHHAAGGCMLLEGINVIWYRIGESLVHTESAVPADVPALVLLTTATGFVVASRMKTGIGILLHIGIGLSK